MNVEYPNIHTIKPLNYNVASAGLQNIIMHLLYNYAFKIQFYCFSVIYLIYDTCTKDTDYFYSLLYKQAGSHKTVNYLQINTRMR